MTESANLTAMGDAGAMPNFNRGSMDYLSQVAIRSGDQILASQEPLRCIQDNPHRNG